MTCDVPCDSIGFGIARRLGQDGAKVVISSRKAERVKSAVEQLRNEKLDVYGTVCHVGKAEDRVRLVNEVACEMRIENNRSDCYKLELQKVACIIVLNQNVVVVVVAKCIVVFIIFLDFERVWRD